MKHNTIQCHAMHAAPNLDTLLRNQLSSMMVEGLAADGASSDPPAKKKRYFNLMLLIHMVH